jgi:hypothetical protein
MTTEEAKSLTKTVLGRPLYSNASRWSWAKAEAKKIIKSFEDELRPIKEILAAAPKNVTSVQHNSGTGELTYS